ncbi:hypothetical protein F511_23981 [Dorcoceras hygrometricum]|uniref:Uncharacterized protein n=1 Tax=Dorcoceras hygrometricum TaxID=472368 RepID=A0A2Z7D5Q5_9LAMI|nr:hypothetical protein F511_23981 [Dorcoceras hygrometricum]
MRRRFVVATGSPATRRLGLRIVISFPILSIYFQPFVPYLSNPRTLFSRELFRRFPVVLVVVLARARLLPESSGFLAGLVVAQFKDVRASGDTALSSPCWDRSHHEPSDLEYTKAYVRCDSGYDGYHETHLIVAVYSEHVPSRWGRQNEDKAARVRD